MRVSSLTHAAGPHRGSRRSFGRRAACRRAVRGPRIVPTWLSAALIGALFLPAIAQAQGVLLLAHGGREDWNREVLELASKVDAERPVEVAFGMANKRAIQDAVNRLAEREVNGIVAVPLFISSHSSVIRATEYLLGKRDEAPPQMEAFARMSARRAEADGGTDPDFDWMTPIEMSLPVELTGALDGHHMVAEILIARALEVSKTPANEVVVVVAHGPSSEEDNDLWLRNMSLLVERMRDAASFSRIDHLTVRDDAPDDVKAKATQELRGVVERGTQEGKSVLIVPLLLSYGGIEKGIRERIEGLDYRMASQGLLPDDRLAAWVLAQAGAR